MGFLGVVCSTQKANGEKKERRDQISTDDLRSWKKSLKRTIFKFPAFLEFAVFLGAGLLAFNVCKFIEKSEQGERLVFRSSINQSSVAFKSKVTLTIFLTALLPLFFVDDFFAGFAPFFSNENEEISPSFHSSDHFAFSHQYQPSQASEPT